MGTKHAEEIGKMLLMHSTPQTSVSSPSTISLYDSLSTVKTGVFFSDGREGKGEAVLRTVTTLYRCLSSLYTLVLSVLHLQLVSEGRLCQPLYQFVLRSTCCHRRCSSPTQTRHIYHQMYIRRRVSHVSVRPYLTGTADHSNCDA